MPPHLSRSGASNRSSNKSEEPKEDPLRAVVVADTFETTFAPFTLEVPRCLLPLCNKPMLDHTLEFLASAGVTEVYCYAGNHVEKVEEFVNDSRWKTQQSPFKRFDFLRCQATSVGDVMRDLDQKGLMGSSGDFLIVSGDVVADFSVHKAMQKHRDRREKDKNAIMTMILKSRGVVDLLNEDDVLPTFIIDPTKDRCLHYEEAQAGADWGVHVDPETLKIPELDIRQDLIDCRIDICTPDVLSLWSDNFDNQTPRKDFLFGVLKDYELNGKTIHTYVVKDAYANRVDDVRAYAAVSSDLCVALSSGLALDNHTGSTGFARNKHGAQKGDGVVLARSSRLCKASVLGMNTSIGTSSEVAGSVLGNRCQIGKNTAIVSSFIWDDTTVGNNVQISNAIIASEVFIGDNCVIGQGALLSFGVKISPGTRVPPGARITRFDQGSAKDTTIVGGVGGEGWHYEDEVDDKPAPGLARGVYIDEASNDSVSSLGSDAGEATPQSGSRSQSFATAVSDEDAGDRFHHDTVAILVQRMQENKLADDMLSELMGLRFSGGADEVQVRRAVATALMKHIHGVIGAGTSSAADATRKTLERYHTLIRRAQAEQSTEEQVLFLLEIQKDLSHRADGAKILLFAVKDLYDLEVYGEEAFTEWWEDDRSQVSPELEQVRGPSKQFIEWLENAESGSEEDDEDEDD